MLNESQKHNLVKFLDNPEMVNAVRQALSDFFFKDKQTKDINILALERLMELELEKAFKHIQNYKRSDKEKTSKGQVGL